MISTGYIYFFSFKIVNIVLVRRILRYMYLREPACSSIFLTPYQKLNYKSLVKQSPDGNGATGNLNPQSLKNINCSTCVAN